MYVQTIESEEKKESSRNYNNVIRCWGKNKVGNKIKQNVTLKKSEEMLIR